MKQRIHDALLGLVGLAGIAFFALSGASCEAPGMTCAAGHGPFFVKYKLTSGDEACLGMTGDEVGFNTYLTPVGRTEVKDDTGKVIAVNSDSADYNTRNIAIQSDYMGGQYRALVPVNVVPPAGSGVPYAFGPYTSKPDDGDLCYAGGGGGTAALAAAEFNFPGDPMDPMDPGVHLRQEWSDVSLFVTANVPGTQVAGKMKFEDVVAGCSAEYTFYGLYPSIYCGEDVMGQADNDGDPSTPVENDTDDDEDPMTPVTDDDGMPGPDMDAEEVIGVKAVDLYCDAKGDPASGRLGSGINPDFKTICDPVDFHCVVAAGTELVQ
jgi:hypothetical protein